MIGGWLPETSMDIQVLTPAIGAVIKDVDLSRGLNDAEVAHVAVKEASASGASTTRRWSSAT